MLCEQELCMIPVVFYFPTHTHARMRYKPITYNYGTVTAHFSNIRMHYSFILLSSRLLYKNLKAKIYRTIILPVVLYGCEA